MRSFLSLVELSTWIASFDRARVDAEVSETTNEGVHGMILKARAEKGSSFWLARDYLLSIPGLRGLPSQAHPAATAGSRRRHRASAGHHCS